MSTTFPRALARECDFPDESAMVKSPAGRITGGADHIVEARHTATARVLTVLIFSP